MANINVRPLPNTIKYCFYVYALQTQPHIKHVSSYAIASTRIMHLKRHRFADADLLGIHLFQINFR